MTSSSSSSPSTSKAESLIQRFNELTAKSINSLAINNQLSNRLHQVQCKLIQDEDKTDQLSTKFENSTIFLQHLTSLSHRLEILERQLYTFENERVNSISATKNQGLKEFKEWKQRNLNWRTTETTFENLTMEYEYLTEQLKIANEDDDTGDIMGESTEYSIIEEHPREHEHEFENSLFSNVSEDYSNTNITTEEDILDQTPTVTPNTDNHHLHHQQQQLQQKRRRLLKKESFLHMPHIEAIFETPEAETTIRGFNIDYKRLSMGNNDQLNDKHQLSTQLLKKPSILIKKSLHKTELPIIEEQFEDKLILESENEDEEDETIGNKENFGFPIFNKNITSYHKRHISLPETPQNNEYGEFSRTSIDSINDTPVDKVDLEWFKKREPRPSARDSTDLSMSGKSSNSNSTDMLRHFVSYDTGLNRSSQNIFNLNDFKFLEKLSVGNTDNHNGIKSNTVKNAGLIEENDDVVSGSPFSTIKHSFIDDDEDEDEADGYQFLSDDDDESENSYGEEEAKPFLLSEPIENPSFIKRSTSHGSIFLPDTVKTTSPIKTKPRFIANSNNKLKIQTMKWLTPNQPTVESNNNNIKNSDICFEPIKFRHSSIQSNNSKDTINNNNTPANSKDILNSVVNSTGSSVKLIRSSNTPIPASSPVITPSSMVNMSWLFHSNTQDSSNDYDSDTNSNKIFRSRRSLSSSSTETTSTSSWFSNLIPNSSIVLSETGKLIGQPSSCQLPEDHYFNHHNYYNPHQQRYMPHSSSKALNNQHDNQPYVSSAQPSKSISFNLNNHGNSQSRRPAMFKRIEREHMHNNSHNNGISGSFNGSHSTLFINKNGTKVIKHGNGSILNKRNGDGDGGSDRRGSGGAGNVLATRISHSALRDALDSSF